MDIERAKAVSDVAQVIINSAKVEVEHMKIAGGSGSGFIVPADGSGAARAGQTATGTLTHQSGVTTHKLR